MAFFTYYNSLLGSLNLLYYEVFGSLVLLGHGLEIFIVSFAPVLSFSLIICVSKESRICPVYL